MSWRTLAASDADTGVTYDWRPKEHERGIRPRGRGYVLLASQIVCSVSSSYVARGRRANGSACNDEDNPLFLNAAMTASTAASYAFPS